MFTHNSGRGQPSPFPSPNIHNNCRNASRAVSDYDYDATMDAAIVAGKIVAKVTSDTGKVVTMKAGAAAKQAVKAYQAKQEELKHGKGPKPKNTTRKVGILALAACKGVWKGYREGSMEARPADGPAGQQRRQGVSGRDVSEAKLLEAETLGVESLGIEAPEGPKYEDDGLAVDEGWLEVVKGGEAREPVSSRKTEAVKEGLGAEEEDEDGDAHEDARLVGLRKPELGNDAEDEEFGDLDGLDLDGSQLSDFEEDCGEAEAYDDRDGDDDYQHGQDEFDDDGEASNEGRDEQDLSQRASFEDGDFADIPLYSGIHDDVDRDCSTAEPASSDDEYTSDEDESEQRAIDKKSLGRV